MLRASHVLLITMMGQPALAAPSAKFDFVPATGEARAAMTNGDFRRALTAFDETLASTAFGRSATGRATRDLLLLKNGLAVTAITSLTHDVKPASLPPALLKIWTEELNASPLVTDGSVSTAGAWSKIVDNTVPNVKFTRPADVAQAFRRLDAIPKNQINARARLAWQIANGAPLVGDTGAALKALDLIKNSAQTAIKADAISIAAARVLYQRNDVDGTLHALDEVPKSSSLWTEALEVRVWTNLRRNDFDKALGGITTLLSPALDPLVGPEPFFLSNLMSLKTCDYSRLFKTSDTFKARHRERLGEMQALAEKGQSPSLGAVLERLDNKGLSIDALGPLVARVPRAALRDRKLRVAVENRRFLLKEAALAIELKDERASLFAKKESENLRRVTIARLRELAKLEVAEYRGILNKLHILEAEVIERMNLDENLKGQRGQLAKVKDQGDVLVFPYNSDEVWLDELDNYKARVKDCPTLKGAGL